MRSVAERFVAAPTTAAEGGPGLVQGAVRRFYLEASPEHQRSIRSQRDLRLIVTHFTGSVTGKRVVQRPGRAAAYDHGNLERVRVVGLNPRAFVGVEYPR